MSEIHGKDCRMNRELTAFSCDCESKVEQQLLAVEKERLAELYLELQKKSNAIIAVAKSEEWPDSLLTEWIELRDILKRIKEVSNV